MYGRCLDRSTSRSFLIDLRWYVTQSYPKPLRLAISGAILFASSRTNRIFERALNPALTLRFGYLSALSVCVGQLVRTSEFEPPICLLITTTNLYGTKRNENGTSNNYEFSFCTRRKSSESLSGIQRVEYGDLNVAFQDDQITQHTRRNADNGR
jgi:hypothetical protein